MVFVIYNIILARRLELYVNYFTLVSKTQCVYIPQAHDRLIIDQFHQKLNLMYNICNKSAR
jgi:hypothetical protein